MRRGASRGRKKTVLNLPMFGRRQAEIRPREGPRRVSLKRSPGKKNHGTPLMGVPWLRSENYGRCGLPGGKGLVGELLSTDRGLEHHAAFIHGEHCHSIPESGVCTFA